MGCQYFFSRQKMEYVFANVFSCIYIGIYLNIISTALYLMRNMKLYNQDFQCKNSYNALKVDKFFFFMYLKIILFCLCGYCHVTTTSLFHDAQLIST